MHPTLFRTACRLAAALALAAAAPAAAQQVPADTAARPLVVRADSVPAASPDSTLPMSPGRAFVKSLVIPGWAQSELGSPVRGGIYFALEAGSLWMYYKSAQKLEEAQEVQRIQREAGVLGPDAKLPLVRDRENQAEDWLTLSIFWLFFSGADAFVAAHLADFDVHVGVVPRPDGAVQLQATVPLP